MASPIKIPRERELRAWMLRYNITYEALAEQLGMSKQRVTYLLTKKEFIPVKMHKKCLYLGFPKEFLPLPLDQVGGRPRKKLVPIFPGLINQMEQEQTDA